MKTLDLFISKHPKLTRYTFILMFIGLIIMAGNIGYLSKKLSSYEIKPIVNIEYKDTVGNTATTQVKYTQAPFKETLDYNTLNLPSSVILYNYQPNDAIKISDSLSVRVTEGLKDKGLSCLSIGDTNRISTSAIFPFTSDNHYVNSPEKDSIQVLIDRKFISLSMYHSSYGYMTKVYEVDLLNNRYKLTLNRLTSERYPSKILYPYVGGTYSPFLGTCELSTGIIFETKRLNYILAFKLQSEKLNLSKTNIDLGISVNYKFKPWLRK